jgi:hypothetical protein
VPLGLRSVLSDAAAEGVDHLRRCVVEGLEAAERGEGPLAVEVGGEEAHALRMRYTTDIHVKENLPCEVSVRASGMDCDDATHEGVAFRSSAGWRNCSLRGGRSTRTRTARRASRLS